MTVRVTDVLEFLGLAGGPLLGAADTPLEGPGALHDRSPRPVLAFCDRCDEAAQGEVCASGARAVLVATELLRRIGADDGHAPVLIGCASPRFDFIRVVDHFWPEPLAHECLSGSGLVHPSAVLAPDVYVEPGATVGPGCEIGAGSVIRSGAHLYRGTRVGNRVVVDANAVIGAPGFGFSRDDRGRWQRFPQRAGVVLGDDVEVGAGVCIDRGALSDTVIGRGTKIDNLAYIAHNVWIGEDCLVMASAVLAGSCRIEDRAVVSPGACVRNGCVVGEASHVGMGAVVVADVPGGVVVAGIPARVLRKGSYQE